MAIVHSNFVKVSLLVLCYHGLHGTLALPLPPDLALGGQFQFLTNISLLLTCISLTLDILPVSAVQFQLTTTRIIQVVCNLEFVVTVVYWMLYFYFSAGLNTSIFVPLFLDLEIHLFPFIALTLVYTRRCQNSCKTLKRAKAAQTSANRTKTASFGLASSTLCTFAALATYWGRFEYMAKYHGLRYPYPFLYDIRADLRIFWLMVFAGIASSNYYFQLLAAKFV